MAITITGGVGSRDSGEIVQRQTATGATRLRLEGTFATLGVKTVEARVVVSGGSVEVTNWTTLTEVQIGATTFKGYFSPISPQTFAITAVNTTNPVQLTIAGRHGLEVHRTASVTVTGNGTPSVTLNGSYTATGMVTADVLTIPVDNSAGIYQVNGSVQITRALEVPIARDGIWYQWQIRTKDAAGTVLETLNSTVDWGVGLIFLVLGQSNADNLFDLVDAPSRDAPDAMVSWWNGSAWAKLTTTPAGNGIHRLLNTIQDACTETAVIEQSDIPSAFGNIPVGAIRGTHDSSAMFPEADWANGGAWLTNPGGIYGTTRARVLAGTDNYNIEGVIWQQGETEVRASGFIGEVLWAEGKFVTEPGAYQAALITLYDRLRSGEGYKSPVQSVLPFCVSPPVRMWAGMTHTQTTEVGSALFQSSWSTVVNDALCFSHLNGESDIVRNIKAIQPGDILKFAGNLLITTDEPHGIKHTAAVRIENQAAISGSFPGFGVWQVDINGPWIATRVSDTQLIIPQPAYGATFLIPEGRVVIERGAAYASTRDDETGADGLHLTAGGCATLAAKMARAIARRCGIEGDMRTLTINGISAAATPVVTFTAAHGLPIGARFYMQFTGTDSTPTLQSLQGGWYTVTVATPTTVAINVGQITTAVPGTTGTGRAPGRRATGYTVRGPRIVAAVFGDEITGTVAAERVRDDITLYVKHERGTDLTWDTGTNPTPALQAFEVCDEYGPLAITAITKGPAALTEGGLQRLLLTLERDTSQTEGKDIPYNAPDRLVGSHALIKYGMASSTAQEAPTNQGFIYDNAAGLAMALLPTFGYLSASQPTGGLPLSPLAFLPRKSRSFIITTIATTQAAAATAIISGPTHATEFWRYLGSGARQIRPGDRWFQITAAGVRINEGTVRRVGSYTDTTTNVTVALDRSVATTDGNYLYITNETDAVGSIVAISREGMTQGG